MADISGSKLAYLKGKDTVWGYRKQIPITGQSGAGADYQIPLEVHSGSGTDSNGVVYLGGHCTDFPNDIRFTDDDGSTKLDYWLENVGEDGAWCWFQDPRAIHYSGTYDKTYFGLVTTAGDVKIFSHNHSTGVLDSYILKSAFQVNDHAAPSILIRNDGKLIVFYSAHNGSAIYYRISTNVEDISAWGTEQSISPQTDHSYPTPIQLSGESNKIYLFFRGGPSGYANRWYYVTSTDGGDNWSSATLLFEQGTSGQHQYLKIESNGNDKIYFTHSGHPVNETTSIYFFYYYDGSYYKADDTEITASLPLDRADIDLVYDASGGYKAWIWDIAVSGSTYYIVFAHFVSTTDHRYDYARWTGSAWDVNEITTAGSYIDGSSQAYYSGGICLDHENPETVYLSKEISSQWEIQKWTTSDGGSTWGTPNNLTSNSAHQNVRPVVIRNHSSDLVALWMYGEYNSYTDYDTTIYSSNLATEAKFWIEVQDDLGSNQDFYIYYGKSGVSSASSIAGTFVIGDDFDDNLFDDAKWSRNTSTYIKEQNKHLEFLYQDLIGTIHICDQDVDITNQGLVLECTVNVSEVQDNTGFMVGLNKAANRQSDTLHGLVIYFRGFESLYRCYVDGTQVYSGGGLSSGNHTVKIVFDEETSTKFYVDGSLLHTDTTYSPNVTYDLITWFRHWGRAHWVDDIRVRKYIDPEPVVGTAESEEKLLAKSCYTKGKDTFSAFKVAYVNVISEASGSNACFIKGKNVVLDSNSCYMAGGIQASDSTPCYVKGKAIYSSSKSAFLKAQKGISSSKSAFIILLKRNYWGL